MQGRVKQRRMDAVGVRLTRLIASELDLREQLAVMPPRGAQALERLVAQNLLSGGAPGYYLTGQGAGVNSVMNGTVEQAVSKALDDATPYERTSFRRMLERVIGHLRPTS